jgi:hypothetical protein
MVPFDYIGRNWAEKNRVRRLLLEVFLAVCVILLSPLILLGFLMWSLWKLAHHGRIPS